MELKIIPYRLTVCKVTDIFAVSTYNTDYILVKEHKWGKAMSVLMKAGYKLK